MRILRRDMNRFVAAFAVLLSALCGGEVTPLAAQAEPTALPIYKLGPPIVPKAGEVLLSLFPDAKGLVVSKDGTKAEAGALLVEVDPASGGVWAADRARLWNPALDPKLPTASQAEAVAQQAFAARGVPESGPGWVLEAFLRVTSWKSTLTLKPKKRVDVALDYTFTRDVVVEATPSHPGFPVVGGGGKFTVAVGEQGRVIGFSGTWRPVVAAAFHEPPIPVAQLDQQYEAMAEGLEDLQYTSHLAYYAAPWGEAQTHLCPVRVYTGTARHDGRDVPLRATYLAATNYGVKLEVGFEISAQGLPQHLLAQPLPGSMDPEGPEEAGLAVPPTLPLTTGPVGPWAESGTTFIGVLGGLPGSAGNAQGFLDELAASGWKSNFRWGDRDCWELDWHQNDDLWVDAADFVFYTGHADSIGFVMQAPDDDWLDYPDVDTRVPPDRWGQQDLEWVVVAACGPLQDDLPNGPGGGDVFERWSGAFDGLHLLLAYASITYDNDQEGRRLVSYVRNGATVLDAWFRVGREIQPSDVWTSAIMPFKNGALNPQDDSVWGFGAVSADIVDPDGFIAIWTRG
jgi:hypothetical protein